MNRTQLIMHVVIHKRDFNSWTLAKEAKRENAKNLGSNEVLMLLTCVTSSIRKKASKSFLRQLLQRKTNS